MKKPLLTILLAVGVGFSSYAQLGGLMRKAANAASNAANTVSSRTSPTAVASSMSPDLPIKGPMSPVHQKHKGEIVFASTIEALTTQEENEAAFSKTFTLGKPIYFRAYADNSLSNNLHHLLPATDRGILDVQCGYRISFFLDGAPAYNNMINQLTEDQKQYASFKGAFTTDGEENYIGIDLFRLFVTESEAKLTPGAHKLKIELAPACEYPENKNGPAVAVGEITLNVGSNTANPNDPKTCLPTASMTDPALATKMLAAFKAKGWPEKATAVRIISTQWGTVRHELTGVILKRTIAGAVASTKDGKCQYQKFLFAQDYDGTNYQPLVYIDGIGSPTDIPCGCLK